MITTEGYKRKLEARQAAHKGIYTGDQALAERIWLSFGKDPKMGIGRLTKIIQVRGSRFVEDIWRKSQTGRSPVALFTSLLKK